MWSLLREVLLEAWRLAVALGLERVDQWKAACEQVLARERQRLFEALALLCLGLMLLALGLCGLLVLAWWALPDTSRGLVMGLLLAAFVTLGLLLLEQARRRVAKV